MAATCLAVIVAPALALDQPVAARKLILRRTTSGQEKIAFVTKDETVLIPDVGSTDDPATGTPGGVKIELFSQNEGTSMLIVPNALGWFVRSRTPITFKFVNKLAPTSISPVSSLLLKKDRAIRLRSASIGLPLTGPQGKVGIRITIGSLRTCALFDEATIRRDDARVFLARDAVAESLADCSNASLGGPTCLELGDAPTCGGTCPPGSACGTRDLSTCECIAAAQPCGDTYPVCNGQCPAGQECGDTGGFPLPGCGCVPAASTPCGSTYPTCGGSCPAGLSCFPNSVSLPCCGTFDFCECAVALP